MIPQELIRKKRDGGILNAEEIHSFIAGMTAGTVTDAQTAAFAMALFFKGMTRDERVALTRAMRDKNTVTLIASERNRLVAFAIMYFGEEHAHLTLLAVRPSLTFFLFPTQEGLITSELRIFGNLPLTFRDPSKIELHGNHDLAAGGMQQHEALW